MRIREIIFASALGIFSITANAGGGHNHGHGMSL